jgi:hypothetical protein
MRSTTASADDQPIEGAARFAWLVRTCFVTLNIRKPAQGWCIPKAR